MSITTNYSTNIGKVRWLIGDIIEPGKIDDASITTILSEQDNDIIATACKCIDMLVAYYSLRSADIGSGDQTEKMSNIVKELRNRQQQLMGSWIINNMESANSHLVSETTVGESGAVV